MIILLIFLLLHTATSDVRHVEVEKTNVCSSGITAASDSLRGDGTVNLFSGGRVFVFNPRTKSLVDVFDLSKNFRDIDGPVEAAAASRRGYSSKDFYLMTRVGRVYAYGNSHNGTRPDVAKYNGRSWRAFDSNSQLPLKGDTPNPDCMAAMCEGDNTCYYWRIFNNWKHRTLYCERLRKTSERQPTCRYDDNNIVPPKTMNSDMIRGIKTPCEAMAITHNPESQQTALLYIDKKKVHYFVNDVHEYTISVDEVFGCSSFTSNPMAWAVLAVAMLLVIVVAPVTILVVLRSRTNEMMDVSVQSKALTAPKLQTR